MTLPTQLVLRHLLDNTGRELYGLQICVDTGLPSGTVHPILARLHHAGWLESRWEDHDAREAGRPLRRYHKLNAHGLRQARDALTRVDARYRRRTQPTGGSA